MISIIDVIIIVGYVIGMLCVGYFVGKGNKNQEDYYLAGRSMTWIPVCISIAAVFSGNTFIGGPGYSYNAGIMAWMMNISIPFCFFLVCGIFLPFFYNLKLTSVYEYTELRFGRGSRLVTSIAFIIHSVIQMSSMIYIPALVVNRLTGIKITVLIPVLVVIAVIYTLVGGIKAVMYTDVIQMIVLWGGFFFCFFIALKNTGLSFFEVMSAAQAAGKLKAFDFSFDLKASNTQWAVLLGGTIMWIKYYATDQSFLQKSFTAKNIATAKKGNALSAILMNTLIFLFTILGIVLFSVYGGKEFASTNDIMITFIQDYVPVGVLGLILAALFAAVMSTIDNMLNSMSAVFVVDIYEKYISKGKKASLKISMLYTAIIALGVICFAIIGFAGTTKSVLVVVGKYISYLSGPIFGLFCLAFFTKKANDKGAVIGFFTGVISVALVDGHVNWLWNYCVGFPVALIAGYIFSLLISNGAKTPEEIEEYTVMGQKRKLIAEGKTEEEGTSILPMHFDKYAWISLGFFFFQYLVFAILQSGIF